jgi:hydroxymethylpyrimidine/phosphomethylpyrimidine kinase
MVTLQIAAVCEAFRVAAAKTGMLYSARIINAVADAIESARIPLLVVDPVMVATSGARLLRPDAVSALCSRILPMARIITPNVPEAEALWGASIRTVEDMQAAARAIGERFGAACVVKGGHLSGGRAADVLFDPGAPEARERERIYSAGRIRGRSTHGTGCMFSAALAACLARGEPLAPSVDKAKRFVRSRLSA